jgi:hypothetical protein
MWAGSQSTKSQGALIQLCEFPLASILVVTSVTCDPRSQNVNFSNLIIYSDFRSFINKTANIVHAKEKIKPQKEKHSIS